MISCVIVAHRQHASKTGFLYLSSIWASLLLSMQQGRLRETPPPSSRRYSLAESVLAQRPAQWLIEDVEDAMLAVESEKRRERAEARKSKYAPHMSIASRDEPSHGGVRDVSSLPRLRKERGSQPQPPVEAGRAELLGNWLLSPTSTRYRASDFGVECQLALAADGTCTLTATCWDDERPGDPSDDGGATLRCDGRWSLREVGRPLQCVPESWGRLLVWIQWFHGEEVGVAADALPLRWALMPTCLLCEVEAVSSSSSYEARTAGALQLLVRINGREWHFAKHRRPLWQERCALAGLQTDMDGDGIPDLARRLLAEDIMDVDRGGVGHSLGPVGVFLRHQWRRLWVAVAACTSTTCT